MTDVPEVSVVMSVYNGAARLAASVESVLAQEGIEFELVVVDDGSTDASAAILDELAGSDRRLRVLRQDNRGLTRALVRGCALARGAYIARQDCGDLSLPGRLRSELAILRSRPDAALVSCGARFVGPAGEPLYDVAIADDAADRGLRTLDLRSVRGPAHHGSTMFPRELYERAGGYRAQFHFAQDLDLWLRLAEHGRHAATPTVLYEAGFAVDSTSSLHRGRQIACAKVILECARLRRAGLSEAAALERAVAIVPRSGAARPWDRAAALYFVGVCLSQRLDPRARRYFRDALRTHPLHLKSAARLLLGRR